MSILTFPTLSRTPSNASFRLRGNTQTQRSPLDGTSQTLEIPGSRWEITVSWESLKEADWRILAAFLAKLRGRAGRFTFSPAIFAPRRGTGTGTPVFNGAGDIGDSVYITGWTPSAPAVFLTGDWFSYVDTGGRQRLHMVTADVGAAGGGGANVEITPPIRVAAAASAPLEIVAPVGVFMLTADDGPQAEVRPPRLGAVSITMEEALA